MQLVTSQQTIRQLQELGGAVYVWPRKARCCGGTVTLDASTARPKARTFRRLETGGIELSLHLELGRKGRVRAFWNGLAWLA
jgi:hypothetical protein